jgi:simple sugar transport system permease protein
MKNKFLKGLIKQHEFYLFFIIIVFSIVISSINPIFLGLENLFDVAKNASGMAILSIGFFIVLLSGGIDVSFTAIAISGQYIAIKTLIALGIDNLWLAFLISCFVGIVLGSINGLFIAVFKIPTLITTLGTLSIFHGGLLFFVGTEATYSSGLPTSLGKFGAFTVFNIEASAGHTYGLSGFVLIVIGVIAVSWIILKYTMLGRSIYAIGGNMESAKRSGINVIGTQFFIYCYAGFLAGIMGIMHVSLIRYLNPAHIVGSEISVIGAVILGGASILGGKGSIVGTLLGVAMISLLDNSLILIGLSSFWHEFFVGLIIIIGVSITSYQNKWKSKRLLAF